MAFYNIVGRKNPSDKGAPKKYYAVQKSLGNVTLEQLAEYVARKRGQSAGTVVTVVQDICNEIAEYCKNGYNVSLGELGIIQLRIRNVKGGAETEEDFTNSNIDSLGLTFKSRKLMKAALQNINFTNVKAILDIDEAKEEETEEGGGVGV